MCVHKLFSLETFVELFSDFVYCRVTAFILDVQYAMFAIRLVC